MSDPLAQPLRLPCGAVLGNCLCKAAMTPFPDMSDTSRSPERPPMSTPMRLRLSV